MTKYSNEFKVKVIKMVLKGDSISHVVKILNMPDIAPLCRWISHYEEVVRCHHFHNEISICKEKLCLACLEF